MTGEKVTDQGARNVLQALADSVEDAGDEEIVEDFRQEGRDPESEARTLRQDLLAFVVNHQRQKLGEEHARSHRQLAHVGRRLPSTSTARRELLRRALEQAPPGLTVQGRNMEEIPDDEVENWLIELAALGCLPDKE